MSALRPNDKRAKNAIIFIWLVLALDIVSVISEYFQLDLIGSMLNGESISMDAANANDKRQFIVVLISGAVSLMSAITFIQWFRRAYYNLHQKVKTLSHTEGWAAGSWFVPFLNLYRPFQIMKEMFLETRNLLLKHGIQDGEKLRTSFVGIWWTVWILSSIYGQAVTRLAFRAELPTELYNITIATMVSSLLTIPLAFVTIRLIRDYSSVEHHLNELNEEGISNIEKELL